MKIHHLAALVLCLLLLSACSRGADIPCLTDERLDWENISEIRLYSDGYYGRSLEEPLVITDADTIDALLEAALDKGSFRPVAEGKALEGLNGLWIDFGNGCVLGMYADRSYGSFCSSPGENGSPCYKLPPKLWRMTNELLEQAQ